MKTLNNTTAITAKVLLILFAIVWFIPMVSAQQRESNSWDTKAHSRKLDVYRSSEKRPGIANNKRNAGESKPNEDNHKYAEHKQHKPRNNNVGNWEYREKQHFNKHLANGIHVQINPRVYPHYEYHHKHHVAFRKIPRKAIWIQLDGNYYVIHRGRFYQPGPMGYYRVVAPKFINQLPGGCQVIWSNGQQYFHFQGILFLSTPIGFQVIV